MSKMPIVENGDIVFNENGDPIGLAVNYDRVSETIDVCVNGIVNMQCTDGRCREFNINDIKSSDIDEEGMIIIRDGREIGRPIPIEDSEVTYYINSKGSNEPPFDTIEKGANSLQDLFDVYGIGNATVIDVSDSVWGIVCKTKQKQKNKKILRAIKVRNNSEIIRVRLNAI